jgi:crotonobetainyl-CoA:carnitine CoA-transferase CaiB-like acyl-CoA transferase
MLAATGAEVIKVEAAPNGDLVRGISKLRFNDRSLYYIQQNLGKKSVCVNPRDPRGMAIVAALVPKVDVVVENFKPGTMAEVQRSRSHISRIRWSAMSSRMHAEWCRRKLRALYSSTVRQQ